MSKVNNILQSYLHKMGIKMDISLGNEPPPKIPKEKAIELKKILYNQLDKQNKFSRIINWIALGMYSVLFGIIIYVIFTFVLKTPQPLSILSGGGGILVFAVGIIKGIRNMSKESSITNTLMLLSKDIESESLVKIVDVIYQSNKKGKK